MSAQFVLRSGPTRFISVRSLAPRQVSRAQATLFSESDARDAARRIFIGGRNPVVVPA